MKKTQRFRTELGKATFGPQKRRSMGVRLGVWVFFAVAVVVSWQNLAHPPEMPPLEPEVKSEHLDYPDTFDLRRQYREQFSITRHVVQEGESFSGILSSLNLSADCAVEWQKECADFSQLEKIQPGEELVFYTPRNEDRPVKLVYQAADGSTFVYRKRGETWESQEKKTQTISITQSATGTISENLYGSCLEAGVPPPLVMELADLFAYDIDFNTDLRRGDTFAVYFQQEVKNGKRVQAGPILAAVMTVNGRRFEAFHYTLPDGYSDYFDADGNSLRKMFLKAPLSYRRISSTFTYRRFHPVLKIFRPHLGIDYAAPAGTPVSALGDGKIVYKGWKGGFGRYVEIQHGAKYKTTYGHLSRYAEGLSVGRQVRQGDVIGYVGSSGLSTGPHLDFRFYENGKPINFLKTAFPHARSVPGKIKADFLKVRETYLAALQDPGVAQADTKESGAP